MDCDDSDFQSQHFQLIGEDNDGFPQSIQSYDPPKFEIDDHFQSHLRFDSLSDSGLFLGIQGEENNWIEDFLPRNSAVEFNSSASPNSHSGRNISWSNAPTSGSAQMLKSDGGDEIDPQVMNTEAETDAKEDFAKSETKSSNDDIVNAEQHGVSPQTPLVEKSEVVVEVSSSDQKFHSGGEMVALQSTLDKELTPSSGDVSKSCLVAGELLEVVQSKEPMDISSTRNNSLGNCDCDISRGNEVTSNFISCNTLDESLTHDASSVIAKLDNSLNPDQKMEECFEVDVSRSQSLHSQKKPGETTYNLYNDCQVNDLHFHDQVIDNPGCVAKVSSELVVPLDSLILSNEGSSNTIFSKNSDGLLEAIAYHVKSLNKDFKTRGEISTCKSVMPSLSVEGDGVSVVRNSVEVGAGNRPVQRDMEGPVVFTPDVQEYLPKDDALERHATLTIESQGMYVEEKQGFTSSKADDGDNYPKLCSSGVEVKAELLPSMKSETRTSEVEDDNGCRIDPLSSNYFVSVGNKESAEDDILRPFTERPSTELDATEETILKEPCADVLGNLDNKESSSVPDKLVPLSETISLVAEPNPDNQVNMGGKKNSAQSIDSSGTISKHFSNVINNSEFSSFNTQDNVSAIVPENKSMNDQAESDAASEAVKFSSSHSSTNTQQLQSVVEVNVDEKEVAMPSVPDSQSTEERSHNPPLLVKKSDTDALTSRHVPDSDANVPTVLNLSDGCEIAKSDEARVSSPDGLSSPAACQSTEGENANSTPTNNSDKTRYTEIETDTLNSSMHKLAQSALPKSNIDSCIMDPQGGNESPNDPSCGSPTVISCKEQTSEEMGQRESNSLLLDSAGPTSELPINSDSFKDTVKDSKVSPPLEDERGFSFVVQSDTDISKKDRKEDHEPTFKLQSLEQPQFSKDSLGHSNKMINETTSIISKNVEDNKRQLSAYTTRKVDISKGDVKEKSQEKQLKGRKRTPRSSSLGLGIATRSKTDTVGVQQCLFMETSTSKAFCSPSIQTSNLPDLNTSSPLMFHQPFTDLQQVQLRAQIFVYGSLIQGVLPDEACMLPAFGGTDGGRSLWEQTWRIASERLLNQKSSTNSSGAHLHYHSEQANSCSPLQTKTLNSPAGWKDSKGPASAMHISAMSLQSPFQSSSIEILPSTISRGTHVESIQSPSPLLSYQASQTRQYMTNSSPWLPPGPHHAPWAFPSQSSPFDSTNVQYSPIAPAEVAQATPVIDPSKSRSTNMQLASTVASLPSQGAANVSPPLVAPQETQNKTATPTRAKNTSLSEKSRKRKKLSAPEELVPKFSVSQPQAESTSATFEASTLPGSACVSLPSISQSGAISAGLLSSTSHATTTPYYQILPSGDPQQRFFSKETCTHIEHSKLQADTASAYASAAVKHSQVIWEQMSAQRKIGFASEVEEKLASAAVAAAAAASVAKAAAEVAKVASEAALQAKLTADEALNSSYSGSIIQNSDRSLDLGNTLLISIPVSIPKDKDKMHGPSIISAARETTRKRVEAASSVIKRAEILNAILKAAEMAAEAASQVATVVSMGDPLPFSINELIEAGSGDHWKLHYNNLKNSIESNDQVKENLGSSVADDHEILRKQSSEQPSNRNERQKVSVDITHNNQKSILVHENNEAHELENGSNTIPIDGPGRAPMHGSSIDIGSIVEVFVDNEGLRGAWFSAYVLDVKDSKAYVCYKHLLSDEDQDNHKEWIPLESKGDQPPRIRVAHRVMTTISELTRKRRREAVGNFNWAVGDRVDVCMRDGWREGAISQKDQDDETKLTVYFPADGESSIVRAWNLRPSLIWKDGQWMEWSRTAERVVLDPYEGDTPHEKRQKLGGLDVKSKSEIGEGGLDIMSRNVHANHSRKLAEAKSLNLPTKDAIFSIGKDVNDENNNDALKVRRAGLQKDGSKVVYGVPKPGKKRKFMEVSKHYTADKNEKETETSDSIKFAKYLIPQASRLWRNSSKVDVKEKQTTNLKTRGAKSLRSQNALAKSIVQKDKSVATVSVSDGLESGLRPFSTEEKKSSLVTDSSGKVDVAAIESSLQPGSGIPTSKRKIPFESVTVVKEKVSSAVDQLPRSEIKVVESSGTRSDAIEPRRSNRRIQPTSRLLEGLQSALIISKTPNVSHDRGSKTLHIGQSHG